MFREIENILLRMCYDWFELIDEECNEVVDMDYLFVYIFLKGGGVRVIMSSSIFLLFR